jgi:hypothetical protein
MNCRLKLVRLSKIVIVAFCCCQPAFATILLYYYDGHTVYLAADSLRVTRQFDQKGSATISTETVCKIIARSDLAFMATREITEALVSIKDGTVSYRGIEPNIRTLSVHVLENRTTSITQKEDDLLLVAKDFLRGFRSEYNRNIFLGGILISFEGAQPTVSRYAVNYPKPDGGKATFIERGVPIAQDSIRAAGYSDRIMLTKIGDVNRQLSRHIGYKGGPVKMLTDILQATLPSQTEVGPPYVVIAIDHAKSGRILLGQNFCRNSIK